MFLSTRRRISRLPIATALLTSAAFVAQANADVITSSVNVNGTTPTTGFTAVITASGSATVNGSGKLNTLFGGTQSFSLPNQTVPINLVGGQVSVVTNPTGTVSVAYDNSSLGVSQLTGANINLLNGSNVPIAFQPVTFNISTSIIGINVNLGLDLNVTGALTSLIYHSTGGSPPLGGTNPAFYAIPGLFDIGGSVQATGSTSILGINVSLGQLINEDISQNNVDALSSIGGLPGVATLTDIVTPNPATDDLGANFAFPDLGIAIPSDVVQSGTITQNPGGGSFGSLNSLNINYSLNLTLTLSHISYNLSGTVPGVVVPEVSTLVMTGLAGVGLVGAGVRKLRRRKAA